MAQRKAITFIGTSNYEYATYEYQGQSVVEQFFCAALIQFFQPDVLQVVMTVEARQKHWESLQQRLSEVSSTILVQEIDIATGRSEADLWSIFATIEEYIEPGDQLIFDITHSFRSQPLLVLLIAGYVRVIKQVEVEALVYGAYEARKNDIAPVFDLTPFVRLLDWTAATDMFIKTGRANDLANLVQKSAQEKNVPTAASQETSKRPDPQIMLRSRWKKASEQLESLSVALGLTRPMEAMESAHKLLKTIEGVQELRDQVSHPSSVQPFVLLLEPIVEQFKPIALNEPEKLEHHAENIDHQKRLLQWYLEHQQPVQAITLGRELLVSQEFVACYPQHSLKDRDQRHYVEETLNVLARKYRDKCQISPDEQEVAKLWDELSTLRNDVAHVGMRQNARISKDIWRKIVKLCHMLLNRTG